MTNKEIGAMCADFRKTIDVKQGEIASELNVSVETISAFEITIHGRCYCQKK